MFSDRALCTLIRHRPAILQPSPVPPVGLRVLLESVTGTPRNCRLHRTSHRAWEKCMCNSRGPLLSVEELGFAHRHAKAEAHQARCRCSPAQPAGTSGDVTTHECASKKTGVDAPHAADRHPRIHRHWSETRLERDAAAASRHDAVQSNANAKPQEQQTKELRTRLNQNASWVRVP